MKLHMPGEKGKAICEGDGLVSTTFRYRDVPFSDGSGVARKILVGVCDRCGKVVSIPPQSTPSIRAARRNAQVSIEAVLPAVYLDALDLACWRIDPEASQEFRKPLLMHYLHGSSLSKAATQRLARAAQETAMVFKPAKSVTDKSGTDRKRLSMKVSPAMSRTVEHLAETTRLSKTDLIKGAIVQISREIVGPARPARLDELRSLAQFANC
ncbi:MAG: hypothetical protein K9G30_05575 [Parvibaculum sp.]|nr:hypothetical protein [Parvibaculum sp.]